MSTIVSIDQWEHSKENILPVKSGRKAQALARAFTNTASSLSQERQYFEDKIREASENEHPDPLSDWIEYFIWARENFPSSRSEQLSVIQSATKLFRNSPVYQQDERYLRLWIRYADMLSNPVEMFQYLYNKDIGTNFALFYDARAVVLENFGKYKDAEESYKLGINRKVEPVDCLKQKYNLFTKRMEKRVKILLSKREEKDTRKRSERTSERRKKGLGSKTNVSKTLGYSTMPVVPLQEPNRVISVLCDEPNRSSELIDDIKVEWNEFATEEEATKENILTASAWTGKTLPQKTRIKPSQSCSFSIYIDPECQEQLIPPNDNSNSASEEEDSVDLMEMIKQIKSRSKKHY